MSEDNAKVVQFPNTEKNEESQEPVRTSGFMQVEGDVAKPAETYAADVPPQKSADQVAVDEPVPSDPPVKEAPQWTAKKGCFQYRTPEDVVKDASKLRIAFLENGAVCMGMEAHNAGLDHVFIITAGQDQFTHRPILKMIAPVFEELMSVEKDQLLNYQVSAKSIIKIYPLQKFDLAGIFVQVYVQQIMEMWAKRVTLESIQQEAMEAQKMREAALAQARQQEIARLDQMPPEARKEQIEFALKEWEKFEKELKALPPTANPMEQTQRDTAIKTITERMATFKQKLKEVTAALETIGEVPPSEQKPPAEEHTAVPEAPADTPPQETK